MTYEQIVHKQLILWLNGKPQHLTPDSECAPDFSCCYPELYTKDINERNKIAKRILENLNYKPEGK